MTDPACTPLRSAGPSFRIGRYHFTCASPFRWGCSTPHAGAFLGVGNFRTPLGALVALRRAEREIPA
jgi:hypothetical protein